jgi:hypothetical protein
MEPLDYLELNHSIGKALKKMLKVAEEMKTRDAKIDRELKAFLASSPTRS